MDEKEEIEKLKERVLELTMELQKRDHWIQKMINMIEALSSVIERLTQHPLFLTYPPELIAEVTGTMTEIREDLEAGEPVPL